MPISVVELPITIHRSRVLRSFSGRIAAQGFCDLGSRKQLKLRQEPTCAVALSLSRYCIARGHFQLMRIFQYGSEEGRMMSRHHEQQW